MRHRPDTRSGARLAHALLALVAATLLAAMLVAPASASAHVPFVASGQRTDRAGTIAVPYPQAEPIPSPYISRAIYGYLQPGAAFDAYTFTVPTTLTVEVGLIVPQRVGLETFRPSLRIYAENSAINLAVPDPGISPRPTFYEPFSAASFWSGPAVMTTFRPDERYYAIVTPPIQGRGSGAYVLTFGGAEKFTVADWLRSLAVLPTIWLGSWAGGPARPGAYACDVLLMALLIAAVWLWARRRIRRRRAATRLTD